MLSAHSKDFANDNRATFQPFGVGGHSRIGQTLAYAEMRLILARLFFTFDVELADAADVWDWGTQETSIFWGEKAIECASESPKPLVLVHTRIFCSLALRNVYGFYMRSSFCLGEDICCRPALSDCASGDFHSA
jgi:hypothetical protein